MNQRVTELGGELGRIIDDFFTQRDLIEAFERQLATHQRIQSDSHGPNISDPSMDALSDSHADFWGQEGRGSGRLVHPIISGLGKGFADAKVDDFAERVGCCLGVLEVEDIVWLDVAMDDLVEVQILYAKYDLTEHVARTAFRQWRCGLVLVDLHDWPIWTEF